MINLEKCFTKNPALVFRKIGEEFMLVPVFNNVADMDSIFVLNEVGGRIWELIDGTTPVGGIRDIICREFEVTPQEAEVDIVEFIQQLNCIGGLQAM